MRNSGRSSNWTQQVWQRLRSARPARARGTGQPRRRARLLLDSLEERLAPAITLSISNPLPFYEGDSGTSNMIFTVVRSGDVSGTTEVNYTTQDGSGPNAAHAGVDYLATSGTLTFVPSQTTGTIAVPIVGNNILQGNRAFTVVLSNPPVAASFASQQAVNANAYASSATVADINGDGEPDVIVTDAGSKHVVVLLNTTAPGAATVSFATPQILTLGWYPRSVTVADINGDGKPDLITSDGNNHTVSVLLNTTTPGSMTASFAAAQSITTGGYPSSTAVADLNGDGVPDLVVATRNNQSVSVLLNGTTPGANTITFAAPQTLATGRGPYSLAVGDVNGDGKPDIVVSNNQDATVSVLLNTTPSRGIAASFATQQTFATGRGGFSIALGDINGDGKPDVITDNSYDSTVSVLLNTTPVGGDSASFATQQTFSTGTYARALLVQDINGDGKPDILVSTQSSNSVSVLVNTTASGDTTASFIPRQAFLSGRFPYSLAIADINGDGLPDVVVDNYNDRTVSVLLNTNTSGTISNGSATGIIADDDFPAALSVVSGSSPQATALNGAFATPLAVLVVNGHGTPVQGASVIFSAPASGATGSFAGNVTVMTDANGIAQAPAFTADGVAGVYQVTASVAAATNLSTTFSLTNVAQDDLSVVVNDGFSSLVPGTPNTYYLTVANNGPYPLSNVQLMVTLPAAFHNASFTPSTGRYDPNTGQWTGLTLGQSQVITLLLTGTVDPAATGNFVVSAAISPPLAVNDPLSINNSSSDTDSLTPLGDLQVTLAPTPSVLVPGTPITYTITVANRGPSQATAATLGDLVPAVLTGDTWTSSVTAGTVTGNTANGSGNIQETLTLAPGSSITYTLTGTLAGNAAGMLNQTVTLAPPTGFTDPVPSNNSATSSIQIVTADERFIAALYRDELGRSGTLAEWDGWVTVLHSSGGSRTVVATAIAHSTEARRNLIDGWYATYLGRPAQNGEEMGWVTLLQTQTEEQVLSYILGSGEFFNRAQTLTSSGTPQERFVEALYQLVLNRTASLSEADGWVNALPQLGQVGVALQFFNSAEYRNIVFGQDYTGLLHRPPDQQGLHGWTSSSLDSAAVRLAFEGSTEFYNNG